MIYIAKPAEPRINEQIRAREVRLIDEDGTQLGIRPISEALALSETRGKDLLEIVSNSNPPVAKIIDYSKFRYEKEKKLKESRKHQKTGLLKEFRLHPRISEHDLQIKLDHTKEFLEKKYKVRITVVFRGREMQHKELGMSLLIKIKETLDPVAALEQDAQMDGNRLSILLIPKQHKK